MNNRKIITAILLAASILLLIPACTPYVEKKRAAKMKWDKVSAQAKVVVAEDLFRNGRYDDALTTVRQCLDSDPELPGAHLVLGKIHYAQGRFAQAQSSLVQAVGYDDKMHEGWYWLGEISAYNRLPDQALEYYNRALALMPMNTDYIVAVVETFASQGRYEEALGLLNEKTLLLPGNITLKVSKADLLQRMGQITDAISTYNQALMLDPVNADIAEALGYCYIAQQNYHDSSRMFQIVVKNSTGDKKTACLEMLALCSMNGGEYGKAVGYYDELSLSKRNDEELWLKMGQAALGAGSSSRAAVCASRALELRPGWHEAIALRGCAQYLGGDYDTAVTTFSKITTNSNLSGFAWLMSGRCYQQLGQHVLADKAYENASRLNPQSKLVSLLMENR